MMLREKVVTVSMLDDMIERMRSTAFALMPPENRHGM